MSQRFDSWLGNLREVFKSLSDHQKNTVIEDIIDLCEPEQLRLLSTKLEILVKRDYLKCLPLELSFHVLKWLDPISLCRCCLVSKVWNKVISSCEVVWQNACRDLGLDINDKLNGDAISNFSGIMSSLPRPRTWKQIYVTHVRKMKRLMCEDAVERKQLYGHTARVFALCYRGDYLVTGEIQGFNVLKFCVAKFTSSSSIPPRRVGINYPPHPRVANVCHPCESDMKMK